MKKHEVKKPKKLRLARETLRDLMHSDAQKVEGGAVKARMSPESPRCCPTIPTECGQT